MNWRGPIKPITGRTADAAHRLKPTLSWPHLVAMGIGAIVGAGIFTLTGVGAERAGPAVLLSFAIAGAVCACAALAYAELATMIPAAGSAYTYTYSVAGETAAWIVGWSLILEYTLVCSSVATGWSAHLVGWLGGAGLHLPPALLGGPTAGGLVNLPAAGVALVIAGMLMAGTRESATLNIVLVAIKLVALVAFVVLALPAFRATNLHPFMPHGFGSHAETPGGHPHGVMAAAAIIFFAFYGFDTVATSAEEARNPGRDLTIGIVGSMIACTTIYIVVALAAVGAVATQALGASGEPLALVLRTVNQPRAAFLIETAALLALPSVILVFLYGQSRIFFVMARDGLLPRWLSAVSRTGGPVRITGITGVAVAIIAGLVPLDQIAVLANAGTLTAFIAVGACMIALRRTRPELPRAFRCPAPYLVGTLTVLGCLYLMASLPGITLIRFLIWNAAGLLIYALFSRSRSRLAQTANSVTPP